MFTDNYLLFPLNNKKILFSALLFNFRHTCKQRFIEFTIYSILMNLLECVTFLEKKKQIQHEKETHPGIARTTFAALLFTNALLLFAFSILISELIRLLLLLFILLLMFTTIATTEDTKFKKLNAFDPPKIQKKNMLYGNNIE